MLGSDDVRDLAACERARGWNPLQGDPDPGCSGKVAGADRLGEEDCYRITEIGGGSGARVDAA